MRKVLNRRFHTSPENFKPLAIIILSGHYGEIQKKETKKDHISNTTFIMAG